MIGELWAPWQINLDKYPPEFERVELTPQGLRVHFPRGTRSLELPLGFQQFSEGFAWMCEQINLHGTALSEPPRSLATLTYTWGYWALDDRLGGIPRNAVAMRSSGPVVEVPSLVELPLVELLLVEAGALVGPGPDEDPAAGGPPQAARRRATTAGLRITASLPRHTRCQPSRLARRRVSDSAPVGETRAL
jgi:hypothetical protein